MAEAISDKKGETMQRVMSLMVLLALGLMASEGQKDTFNGFLGVQSCVQNGVFSDCDLKKYHDGDNVVAVINGQTYHVDKQKVSQSKIDGAIMKNNIAFSGTIVGNVLKLDDVAFTTTKKEFSKGCM